MSRVPALRRLAWLLVLLLIPGAGGAAGKAWIPGWKSAPAISAPRTGHGLLVIGETLHVIGGADRDTYFSATEYARIQPDGGLSAWRRGEHELKVGRAFHGVARAGGHVYAVGGSRTDVEGLLDSVERAEILEDGTLGPWTLEKTRLNIPRRCVHVAVIGDYLYAVGGFGGILLDSVERARIEPDGGLGEWELLIDTMLERRYVHAVEAVGGRLYVLGGHDKSGGMGIPSVEWAQSDGEGMFEPWRPARPMRQNRFGLEAAVHGGYLYALGGLDGVRHLAGVEKGRLSAHGGVTGWEYTTSLPGARGSFGAAVYRDGIYIVGGSTDKDLTNEVAYAFFNDRGDIGYWGTQEEAARIKKERAERRRKIERRYPHEAKIIERLGAGRISFLKVQREDGMVAWLAVPAGGYQVGMRLRFSNGTMMAGFFSKTLNRRFRTLMFVRDLYPVEGMD